MVQDIVVRPHVVRYRRERWLTPDGTTITAALPAGVSGHFGPELRRFVLAQHHQGQVTTRRVGALLRDIRIDISDRQVMRLLAEGQDDFLDEARDVLRVGLTEASWISVDDTGARHKAANGVCTQIGNDPFRLVRHDCEQKPAELPGPAACRSLGLRHQCRGAGLYADPGPGWRLDRPAGCDNRDPLCRSANMVDASDQAWQRAPNPATRLFRTRLGLPPRAPSWAASRRMVICKKAVILSDGAGQFAVGRHALCRVHAERLVHKLETFTDPNRAAQRHMRGLIWPVYRAPKAYHYSWILLRSLNHLLTMIRR